MAGSPGAGLAAAAAASPGTGSRAGRCPSEGGRSSSTGCEGPVRVRRDRWGVPHIEAESREDLWFAQGFCHGQDRLWQMDFYRRVVERAGRGDRRGGGAAGRPADAHARHPAHGRARGGDARPRAARRCWSASAPASTPPPRAPRRCPSRCSCCASRLRALAAGRHPQPRQAARLRPLDQLGAGAAARRHGARAGPGAGGPPRPGLPGRQPGRHPGSLVSGDGLALVEQIDAVRRSIGLAAEASGSNNWAVSGARSARPARR